MDYCAFNQLVLRDFVNKIPFAKTKAIWTWMLNFHWRCQQHNHPIFVNDLFWQHVKKHVVYHIDEVRLLTRMWPTININTNYTGTSNLHWLCMTMFLYMLAYSQWLPGVANKFYLKQNPNFLNKQCTFTALFGTVLFSSYYS